MDGCLLAFGLIPGPRELIIVALVVMALYGRSSTRLLMATPYGRRLAPWVNLLQRVGPASPSRATAASREATRPGATASARPRPRGLWFPRAWWSWLLLLSVAGMAAAWVALRITVHHATLSR